MNANGETKFEERLNKILTGEGQVNEILDNLEDEDQKTQIPDTVEYANVPTVIDAAPNELNQDTVDDYKHARNTLYGLIERGTVALEGSLIIARESEHPRAYEVASTLMKNISEITKDLLELQKSLKPEIKIGKQVNQQNNYYTSPDGGSGSESKDITALLDGLDDV